jgi:hypothetical protein
VAEAESNPGVAYVVTGWKRWPLVVASENNGRCSCWN